MTAKTASRLCPNPRISEAVRVRASASACGSSRTGPSGSTSGRGLLVTVNASSSSLGLTAIQPTSTATRATTATMIRHGGPFCGSTWSNRGTSGGSSLTETPAARPCAVDLAERRRGVGRPAAKTPLVEGAEVLGRAVESVVKGSSAGPLSACGPALLDRGRLSTDSVCGVRPCPDLNGRSGRERTGSAGLADRPASERDRSGPPSGSECPLRKDVRGAPSPCGRPGSAASAGRESLVWTPPRVGDEVG